LLVLVLHAPLQQLPVISDVLMSAPLAFAAHSHFLLTSFVCLLQDPDQEPNHDEMEVEDDQGVAAGGDDDNAVSQDFDIIGSDEAAQA